MRAAMSENIIVKPSTPKVYSSPVANIFSFELPTPNPIPRKRAQKRVWRDPKPRIPHPTQVPPLHNRIRVVCRLWLRRRRRGKFQQPQGHLSPAQHQGPRRRFCSLPAICPTHHPPLYSFCLNLRNNPSRWIIPNPLLQLLQPPNLESALGHQSSAALLTCTTTS